jgi:hypothetical protein
VGASYNQLDSHNTYRGNTKHLTLELRPKNFMIKVDHHTSRRPKNSTDLLDLITMEQSKTTHTSTSNTGQVLSDSEERRSLLLEQS